MILEQEKEEALEEEIKIKNKIKDKRDYTSSMAKSLMEMDERLIQLRNKLTLYSDEVSNTS